MEDKITIQKENILKAYSQASEEQKALLENMFGKEMLNPKDVKERVKTLEDACSELGETNALVQTYRMAQFYTRDVLDVIAYLKLRIICAALNEGWKPKLDGNECRYYPWFYVYTKEEYEKLDEHEKKKCHAVGQSYYCANVVGGVVGSHAYCVSLRSYTSSNSRLAFKTKELAEYCGKQFIDIWADYLLK